MQRRSFILSALSLAATAVTQPALAGAQRRTHGPHSVPDKPSKPEHATAVIDVNTGLLIPDLSKNSDELCHPASLTKNLTTYLTLEQIRDKQLKLDTLIDVSAHAAKAYGFSGFTLGLKPGEKITVRDALLGMNVHSANDAAIALAENIAGNEPAFVDLMNKKAAELGMTKSLFINASGLPVNTAGVRDDKTQVTTAHDLAVLTYKLLSDFPNSEYQSIFQAPDFKFQHQPHQIVRRNRAAQIVTGAKKEFPRHDGLMGAVDFVKREITLLISKSGFINASGFNGAVVADQDGRRVAAVLCGASSKEARKIELEKLVYNGLAEATVKSPGQAARPASAPTAAPSAASQPR